MTIPIAAPDIGAAERERVLEILEDGQLADGPVVREFETAFATACDAAHGVATTNGTTALHTALEALSIGRGDRVVTTPFSFVATANAIRLAGAEPVFADVDPETLSLDPEAVETVLRRDDDVCAVLPVHLYGRPAPMDRFRELADAHDAWLIEDAAQAHAATYRGQPVGSLGDVSCFSFYPTKNMTTGEGGIIVTDHDDIADTASTFVNHGRTDTYAHASVGHNFRMTSIAAGLGLAQLEKLPAFNQARRRNAERLTEGLEDTPVQTPPPVPDGQHVYHQYTIRYGDRDALSSHLERAEIGTGVYYPTPIHQQPAYAGTAAAAPVAVRAAKRVLSLPVHPGVDVNGIDRVIDAIHEFASARHPKTGGTA